MGNGSHDTNGGKKIRLEIELDNDTYPLLETVSNKLGLKPSEWINLLVQSKLKGKGRS